MSGLIERPSYLATVENDFDFSELNKIVKPPRLKIIQKGSGAPFVPPFSEGDVAVIPQMTKIGDRETPFAFTPLYFFRCWICMNPIAMKAQLQALREISFEENSEVARKAKNFVEEACPENPKHMLKYSEVLNFMVMIDHPDLYGMPVTMMFQRGEYKTGQMLASLIQSRKAPPYACRFRAVSGDHSGKGFDWIGLDIDNDPTPFVSEKDFNAFKTIAKEMGELFKARQLELDLNDSDVPNPGAETKF